MCPSYPEKLVVLICTPDVDLLRGSNIYREGRFPTATWINKNNGAVLLRAASTTSERWDEPFIISNFIQFIGDYKAQICLLMKPFCKQFVVVTSTHVCLFLLRNLMPLGIQFDKQFIYLVYFISLAFKIQTNWLQRLLDVRLSPHYNTIDLV